MPRSVEFPHSMLASFTPEQWVRLGELAEGRRWPKTEVLRWLVESMSSNGAQDRGDAPADSAAPGSSSSTEPTPRPTSSKPGVDPIPPSATTSPGTGPGGSRSSVSRSEVAPRFKGGRS